MNGGIINSITRFHLVGYFSCRLLYTGYFDLLRCDAVSLGKWLLAFRRAVMHPSAGVKTS
jgi:hypothetical protein